jgi:predicted alpha/beta hydrolase family esterase
MTFIIFHGSFSKIEEIWLPELKQKLEILGQTVILPQFPIDVWDELTNAGESYVMKNQTLENWENEFEKIFAKIDKSEKLCFIGHSLGNIFILQLVEKYNIQLDSAIFVSPFLDKLNGKWQIDHANASFYKTDFDFEKLKTLIPTSYVLYSDNDPYVKKQHAQLFGNALDSSVIFVRQAQHFSGSVNMNEFPLVFDLACTRLDLSMYQGYLKHRIQTDATDKVIMKELKSVTLSTKDVTDEGVFHFRNLKKSGFCTYLSSFEFWDTTEQYYEDGRKAAKRVKDFTRVFVIEDAKHLERKGLLSVMQKDIEAGINVMFCWAKDIEKDVPYLDFGIWDEDYLCIVKYDKVDKSQATEVELNSKESEMTLALEWKKYILSKSMKVVDLEKDVKRFLSLK